MQRRKIEKLPYILVFPAVLILLLYSYLPTPYALILSLNNVDPTTGKLEFIGFENYIRLLSDKNFWESAKNTFVYALFFTVVVLFIGTVVSLILNTKRKGTSFYLTVMFIPWVLSEVVVGSTWRWLLNPDFGVLNYLFAGLGLRFSHMISRPDYVMLGLVMVTLYKTLAYSTILLLAGLQNISKDYIEASKIDGATGIKTLWYIILPIFKPTLIIVALLNIINSISQSGIILVLTNGGPMRSSETLALYLYKEAFRNYQLNNAASISMILAIINIMIVIVYLQINKKNKVSV